MREKMLKRTITYVIMAFLAVVFLTACKTKGAEEDDTVYFHHSMADTETQTKEVQSGEQQEYYLITEVDQIQETLQLYRYENGMEYRYYYGTGTRFYDKYGNRTTVSSFKQGLLVTIGEVNSEGILCEARISDQAWVYEDVSRFSVNPQLHMFKIADNKYSYDETTHIFSGDQQVQMEDIAKGDVLSVVGVDKQILSVCITTAQGTLQLKNTKLFDGSFLQLGNRIFTEITTDMALKVPEGTYELVVANNGWGGSTEVTIVRGETTVVDLDSIKGSGPKQGRIQFLVDVEDAILMIDGEETDYEKPVKLTYGSHSVAVYAPGFDVWKRNLYVNSKKATLLISLKDEGEEEEKIETGGQAGQTETQKTTESTAKESETKSESEKRQEELDLIKDLISGMTDASSIVSN